MPAKGGGYSNAGINPTRVVPPPRPAPPAPQGAPLRGGLAPAPRQHTPPASSPFASPFHQQIHAVRQRVSRLEGRHAAEHAAAAPFTGALRHAYQHQQQLDTYPARVAEVSPGVLRSYPAGARPSYVPYGGLVESGVAGGLEARHPVLGAVQEDARSRALLTLLQGRAQAAAEAKAKSGKGSALDLGFVNLTPIVAALTPKLLPQTGTFGILGRAANEVLDLPGQTFLTGALAGHALNQAVQGHPGEAEGLGKGILGQIEHPIRSTKEAPLATLLTLAGIEGGVGGLVGKLGRLGEVTPDIAALKGIPERQGLIPAFTRQRPDLQLWNQDASAGMPGGREPIAKQQQYPSDPLRKLVTKGYETGLTKLPRGLGGQADPFVAEGLRLRRNLIGGAVHAGRLDLEAGAREGARRQLVKNKVIPEATGLATTKTGSELIPLIVDSTVLTPHSMHADLTGELTRLQEQHPNLTRHEKGLNEASQAQIEKILADKKLMADPSAEFAAAEHAIGQQKPLTALEIHHGSLRPEQTRAALQIHALKRMGARHFTKAEGEALAREGHIAVNEARARLADLQPGSPEHAHVADEVHQLETHRLETSGVPAEHLVGHEQAVAEHQAAVQELHDAQLEQRAARLEPGETDRIRQREAGARSPVGVEAIRRSASGARGERANARVQAAQEREAAARQAVAENPQPVVQAGVRTAEGHHLPDEAIEADMRARGRTMGVGFISHQENIAGSQSFYKRLTKQATLHSHTRTGSAFLKGTRDTSFKALAGQLASQASRVAQHEAFVQHVHAYGEGSFADPKAAELAAQNWNDPESTNPAHQAAQQLHGMVVLNKGSGQVVKAGHLETPMDVSGELERLGLREHMPVSGVEHGKYTLVPKDVYNRLLAHHDAVSARSGVKKFLQLYTQGFRHVKFALSPKHHAGIIEENIIRPLVESGLRAPVDWVLGHKFAKGLASVAQTDAHGKLLEAFGPESAVARYTQGLVSGRGLVGGSKATDIVRKPNEPASLLGKGAEYAGRSLPVKAWLAYRKGSEGFLHQFEKLSQTTLLGAALRKTDFVPAFETAFRTTEQGMREHIEGRLTANKADQIARELHRMGGNWNAQPPAVKAAVSTVTPFGLWWLNSIRWLAGLPIHHPVITGAAAALYQATHAQRSALGQGYDAPGVGTKQNPNYLQGTFIANLPLWGEKRIDLGHYSPLGIAGPEAPTTIADMVLPQGEGVLSALSGTNSLTHEKELTRGGAELGGLAKGLNALSELVSGPTVGATQIQQLLQRGKPYGTANLFTDLATLAGGPSQTKPGTAKPWGEAALGLLDPFRTYKVHPGESPGSPGAHVSPALARAISRSEAGSAFREQRLQRAIERSEGKR